MAVSSSLVKADHVKSGHVLAVKLCHAWQSLGMSSLDMSSLVTFWQSSRVMSGRVWLSIAKLCWGS
jgi:hypothetical protein